MYTILKKTAKVIVPEKVLTKHMFLFRSLVSFFYKGSSHKCITCNTHLRTFIKKENLSLLCPNCGSLSRTRRLYKILSDNNYLTGNVLHFSPSRVLYKHYKKNSTINYYSTDFENEFTADYQYDITKITSEDNFFDIIICYHVLEHIEDDTKAMSELYRVLKPHGKCFIQTPFKSGDIYEDYSITTPLEREKAFGQKDHVRIYSLNGLKSRLENAGFSTTVKQFDADSYHGFLKETIIIASK